MKLYIKNMVCNRCKMVVKSELEQLGLHPLAVQLGEVEIQEENLLAHQLNATATALAKFGFKLLEDKGTQLVEQVKTSIIDLVHYSNEPLKINLSAFLSQKLKVDYQSLSTKFSELEHSTIEQFFISQKIEKVKELLSYGEKTLSEIAFYLNYSSVAHLSSQFKKVTAQTPSEFKAMETNNRKTLDEI
jgi:AraC-like DNA-binding protein